MATIGDVIELQNYAHGMIELFGGSSGFLTELNQCFRKVGDAIAKEHGLAARLDAAVRLPRETPLEPDSQTAFDELRDWLRQNDGQHFENI